MLQVMVPMKYKEFTHGLSVLVKKKFIPMTRINDAVKRILRVKFVMGLFENPMADLSMSKYLGCKVSILLRNLHFAVIARVFRKNTENSQAKPYGKASSISLFIKYLHSEQKHRELAREAVRKSLVLLKNGKSADQPLLPLPKKASKILVAGKHADNIGYQCGGWTISWQGMDGNITSGTISTIRHCLSCN